MTLDKAHDPATVHRLYPWQVCGSTHQHMPIAVDKHVLSDQFENELTCRCGLPHEFVPEGELPDYSESDCPDC